MHVANGGNEFIARLPRRVAHAREHSSFGEPYDQVEEVLKNVPEEIRSAEVARDPDYDAASELSIGARVRTQRSSMVRAPNFYVLQITA